MTLQKLTYSILTLLIVILIASLFFMKKNTQSLHSNIKKHNLQLTHMNNSHKSLISELDQQKTLSTNDLMINLSSHAKVLAIEITKLNYQKNSEAFSLELQGPYLSTLEFLDIIQDTIAFISNIEMNELQSLPGFILTRINFNT